LAYSAESGIKSLCAVIENRALLWLKEKLQSAKAIAEAVRGYHEALNRIAGLVQTKVTLSWVDEAGSGW
jgi:hypothetical protein